MIAKPLYIQSPRKNYYHRRFLKYYIFIYYIFTHAADPITILKYMANNQSKY